MAQRRNEAWPLLNTNITSGVKLTEQDPLFLHSSDNPGMVLVTTPLAGNNFLPWKRSMIISLNAKTKIGFINGEIEKPDEKDEMYIIWKKVDWTVLSWILNSLSKDIAESFMYAESAKDLWDEICQRYGENNGPMKYKLQREITSLNQGNDTVMEYFGKLKKLWDEYACVSPVRVCDCVKGKQVAQHEAETKLIQFLMGLNDGYDHLKNQIMLLDPLPSVNKAYSMALTAERQRSVQNLYSERMDHAVLAARTDGYGRGNFMGGRGGTQWGPGRGRGC